MAIRGIFSAADLVSATWVHLRPRRSLAIVGAGLLFALAWAIWAAFFGRFTNHQAWQGWAFVGVLVYLIAAFGVGIPYKCRRAYRQRKDLQRECSFAATDQGVGFSSDAMSGTKPWADYLKWKEGKRLFLLYMSDNLYQVIPKRFFASESEVDSFRETLRANISRCVV
jgi:MFS family permease